ncbi:hypothetical protein CW751_01170 [Brumimicrobium salinarum]|uniref:Outer membrane protein beta-barrel domain-containing protein n=1 Tax=Brumimicrobium salinarum TaxID=2058658 RepID=A0A2I0R5X2_9FLAO|nr:hypothetical protein [Brumimicrobium salinarum]PKR81978.1 hypothetical protein CW751_01170 [Brumimicrobium salinarum]
MRIEFVKTVFFIVVLSCCSLLFAQNKKPLIQPSVRKLGPYFGIQQGRFTVGEIGMEAQFKNIRFKKPKTHGVHGGLEYNIPNNALGFNLGYWHKPSRVDLTYGVDLAVRSNFETERFGFSPVIGYKLFGFHLRAGYMFLTPSETFTKTNSLFINLRFILVNNRKFRLNKRNKNN